MSSSIPGADPISRSGVFLQTGSEDSWGKLAALSHRLGGHYSEPPVAELSSRPDGTLWDTKENFRLKLGLPESYLDRTNSNWWFVCSLKNIFRYKGQIKLEFDPSKKREWVYDFYSLDQNSKKEFACWYQSLTNWTSETDDISCCRIDKL